MTEPAHYDDAVVRRAERLCRQAEPHAESTPCPAHLREAAAQMRSEGSNDYGYEAAKWGRVPPV